MIKGIGIDAVELPRITRLIEEKPKFIARILTSDEMKLFQSLPFHRQVEFLGGRYACKEAFSKAWGTGIGKVTFQLFWKTRKKEKRWLSLGTAQRKQ